MRRGWLRSDRLRPLRRRCCEGFCFPEIILVKFPERRLWASKRERPPGRSCPALVFPPLHRVSWSHWRSRSLFRAAGQAYRKKPASSDSLPAMRSEGSPPGGAGGVLLGGGAGRAARGKCLEGHPGGASPPPSCARV